MKKGSSCLALLTFVSAQALSQDPSTSRVLSTVEGSGQAFPSKPIRILASGAMQSEIRRMGKVIKAAGIQDE